MTQSATRFSTPNASRYLKQLCKHFGRKVPTEFTATKGRILFPFGACDLTATDGQLTIEARGDDGSIDRLEQVLANHLDRFAFREGPRLVWQRSTTPNPNP